MSIRLEKTPDGLARLTLDRPAHYNALDLEAFVQLRHATEDVAADPSVRVLLLQGAGTTFSGGGDISFFATRRQDAATMLTDIGRALNPTILALRQMSAMVIVSVHGSVAGGSVGLMLAGDLIVAADTTKFNLAYARMGGSPDAGTSWFLSRLVGHHRAMELFALSETFDAARAKALGLIHHVVAADERVAYADALAQRLLAAPAMTLANTKRLVTQAQHSTLDAHLEQEIQAYALACGSNDFAEGVEAFLSKRKPVFGQTRTPHIA